MAPQKVIIDTDPGVDDVLALLLALSASDEELQVLLISLTFGNIDVESCLLNVVSMFHILELERQWRIENGLPTGFGSLAKFKPVVAVGADGPLEGGGAVSADHFHGEDGLQGVHRSAPHFTPTQTWRHMFSSAPTLAADTLPRPPNFEPTVTPAHREILRVLRENEPDSVTIVAVGPLGNLALAAEEDLGTFLRVKEVMVMGGCIDVEGNTTPVGEFNHVACPISASRLYALTCPRPQSTSPIGLKTLKPYPDVLRRTLNLTVFPLDVTNEHLLSRATFDSVASPLAKMGSPLAQWTKHFVDKTFDKVMQVYRSERVQDVDLAMHDPLVVYYLITRLAGGWRVVEGRDVRVEATGQWTRGMCVVDRRSKKKAGEGEGAVVGDVGGWLSAAGGNRVRQVVGSPNCQGMAGEMLRRIYGGSGRALASL